MGQEQQDEKKVHTHTHICGWLYWGRSSRMSDEHIHTQVHAPVAGCIGAGAAGREMSTYTHKCTHLLLAVLGQEQQEQQAWVAQWWQGEEQH
jgi:hypothetical protein